MKTFEMKTVIHFGENALDRLRSIPYKRALVITDPFVVQSGMIELITAPLDKAGITYDIFQDVVPDAPVGKIAEGVKKFLEFQPEVVVAVGGGSAIDSSKAIREFALKINDYGRVGLIAVPTTSVRGRQRHAREGEVPAGVRQPDGGRGDPRRGARAQRAARGDGRHRHGRVHARA